MNVRLKRAKELMGYAVQLTKDEGLPTMVKRGAGFVRRRFFGKRARYLPGKKVLEAQAAEMVGKTAENCGLPTISILTPLYNTPENYLREFLGSFVNQTAPNGQLCLADASDDAHPEVERVVREYQQKNQRIVYKKVENKGIAANTNAAETLATGEYLALADHDDVLAPHAMYAMGKAVLQLREKGEPDGFLYSDEALFTKDIKKPMVGHFKPDYAPDYLLCCNYICHLAVFKRALYEQLGGERPECDGSQDHDLFLRLIEQTGGAAHLPQVLYYWRVHAGSTSGGTDAKPYVAAAAKKALADHLSRTGRTGTVEDGLFPSTYRVKWDIEGDPKVSILIPNKDHTDDLEKCLYSIWSKTEWDNFEVIVIENNSTDPATFAYYKDAEKRYEGLKVVTWPEKGFNFSAINNFGRKAAQGEYLLLLNNDVEVRNGDWLTELLRQCAHPGGAAICGAMLYYPDETLQHAGVVTGLGGYAGHSHKYKKAGGSGDLFPAATAQSATTTTIMRISTMFGFLFAISLTIPYFYNNALKGIALALDIQLHPNLHGCSFHGNILFRFRSVSFNRHINIAVAVHRHLFIFPRSAVEHRFRKRLCFHILHRTQIGRGGAFIGIAAHNGEIRRFRNHFFPHHHIGIGLCIRAALCRASAAQKHPSADNADNYHNQNQQNIHDIENTE